MLIFERLAGRQEFQRETFTRFGPSLISLPNRKLRSFDLPSESGKSRPSINRASSPSAFLPLTQSLPTGEKGFETANYDLGLARQLVREQCRQVAGVYGWVDRAGELIYVGYSANLPNRLLTYFSESDEDRKETRIAARSVRLVWEEVGHPLAAELRELELIRRFHPRMNRQGKTARRKTGYLCLRTERLPRVRVVDELPDDTRQSWGPMTANRRVIDAVHALNLSFGLADCSADDRLWNSIDKCLRFDTGSCSGPCDGSCSAEDYEIRLNAAVEFLDSANAGLIDALKQRMEVCKQQRNFHAAARWRDQWQLLEYLQQTVALQCHPEKHEFVYAPSIGRNRYWFAVRHSQVCAVGRAPTDATSASAISEKMRKNLANAPDGEAIDRGQQNILNRWFRQQPEELSATFSMAEAQRRCKQLITASKDGLAK